MKIKIFENQADWIWLGLAIVASIFLSYGIWTNWTVAFASLAVLLVLFIVLNDFKIGLYLILLSMLAGQLLRIPLADYGGSLLTTDLLVILVTGIWLVKKIIKKEKFPRTPINSLLILFIVFAVISLLFSLNFIFLGEALKASFYLIRFISYVLILFITIDLAKNEAESKHYLYWILGIGAGVAILGFIQLIYVPNFGFMVRFGWDPHIGRLLSTFFDPNFVGGFLGFLISIILAMVLFNPGFRQKKWLIVTGLILFVALLLTFSRSAYLGFMISFAVVTLFKSWKITILGLLIIAAVFFASPRSIDRIKNAWQGDKSSVARIESWKQGWEIISDHPVVGVGFNTLAYIKPLHGFSESGKTAHSASGIDSSFLTIWATTGIVGLVLFLGIYSQIIWQAFKLYLNRNYSQFARAFGIGLGAALIGLFVHSQFVNSLLYSPIMILIWMGAGILFSLSSKYEKVKLNSKI